MSNIKVRFAPSPTGYMHIGNARTALFNWLLAKKLGGSFMLRIDDTDKERSKKQYEDALRSNLQWLGLQWQEEARQSNRFDRYEEITKDLISKGRIYACYETAEELEFMRKRLMAKGKPPIYDRASLKLTNEQIKAYEEEGRKPHYRFLLIDTDIVWQDMVRGECRYVASNLSDPIIIREDGSYLYHLPSVIDDVDFGITHIVRGEDHVTNTASQVQMFEAIGGTVPSMAHLPLLTGKEGKLSKRLGSLGVSELQEMGVEAMSISSYLAKIGTSDAIEPFYNLDNLADSLDFSKIGRSQPKFSIEDLELFNKKLIHNMPYSVVCDKVEVEESFWEAIKGNLNSLQDVAMWQEIAQEKVTPSIKDKELTDLAASLLPPEPWSEETFSKWVAEIKTKTDRKGKDLFYPLRMAITNMENGPELKTLLPLIGYNKIHSRLIGEAA